MFKVNWPRFSDDFIAQASQQLTIALNKGQKPNNIVGDIDVADLNMGTKPPDLEILEIGELGEDRFKGIFKMTYAGDAHVILNTRVQANPLNLPRHEYTISQRSTILAANHPLVVPMRLRISNLKLRGIIVLVIDKTKGTTLVFKNDPLEKVDVNSTFDGVASVRRFLQSQIEGQLRQMFKEDLPMLIHKLSLVLIQQQEEAAAAASSTSSSIQSASGSTDNLKGMGDESDDSLPSSNHKHHHYHPTHLTDETVHRFVNRPHHQKWSGNEPVTVLDSESDAGELESQAIGAYVLHKSLMPDNNLLGLEVVSESILSSSPSSASPTPIPSSIQSDSKSSIKPKSASSRHPYSSNTGALGSGKIGGSGLKSGPSSDGGGGNGSISNFSGNGNSDGVHSHKNSESNEPQLILKDKVTLQPSDNQVTAHLASLMLANHTISPVMHRLEHATFRTGGGVSGTSSSSLAAALAAGAMAATQSPPTHSTAVFSSSSLSSHNVTASPTSSAPIKDPSSPSNGSTEKLSSAPTTPFGAGTRKRGGTRNVHKMTLPSNLTAGMPKSSSSGGIFGLDSSTTGARTASSSGRSLGTSSSIASSTRTSRAPSLNEPAAPTLTTRRSNNLKTSTTFNNSRIEESNESGDELAGLLADRLEIHKNRRVSGQSTSSSTAAAATVASISQQHIGIIKRPSLNRYSTSTVSSGESDAFSDDEPLTIQAKSPPTGAGFISRTSMGVFGHSGVLGINNGGLNENGSPTQMTPPPRSTSSMSTRSAGGSVATITTKKVVRVKSNASSMTITAGSLDKFTKEEEEG
ncbi:ERMES complex subunit [Rhizoclosmatium sp. JEL0117]|nr:ERMES complex subunit [Rhizoclosmatium sp. JEL0117]